MRILESYFSWKGSRVNENLGAAKSFIEKIYAQKLNKKPAELTPDEKKEALSDKAYQSILKIIGDNTGYASAFVKFHFEQRVPIQKLAELFTKLQTEKHILPNLPKNLDQYASAEKVGAANGFEQLNDAIRTLERVKEAKWFIDNLPRPVRDQYRSASNELKTEVINLAHQLSELEKANIARLMEKIKAFSDWKLDDVIKYCMNYAAGFSNLNLSEKISEIESLAPQAGILYSDDRYLMLSMRTEDAQKKLCSVANWCINRGSFSQYARNALQINIFDFSKETTDPMFLTGTTISYDGRVTASHDINDKNIMSVSAYDEHFKNLKYPESLIRAFAASLQTEVSIKKVVYKLSIDNVSPDRLLTSTLHASYELEDSFDISVLKELVLIIQDRLAGIIERKSGRDSIIKIFEDNGVLSKLSLSIAYSLFGKTARDAYARLYKATSEIYAEIEDEVGKNPTLLNDLVKNVLAQKEYIIVNLQMLSDE